MFKPYLGGRQSVKFCGFGVQAFPLKHDTVECRGFYIIHKDFGKLIYMTDLEFCPFDFSKQKINHLFVEANYDKELLSDNLVKRSHVLQGHASLDVALGIIETNKTDALKSVTLCHLSETSIDWHGAELRAKQIVDCPVRIADKGVEYEL